MGVGTLIIFIAVILVAAVAAAVLISTTSNLQQRALVTGGQTEEGVSTGAEAVSVMGQDASTGHDIEQLEMLVRLQSGSESIKLNNTAVVLDTADTSQNLEYSGSDSSNSTHYGVSYVKRGINWLEGYMGRGDIVKLYMNTTNPVGENLKVRIRVIPRTGTATIVEFTTPDVMTDQRITLWP